MLGFVIIETVYCVIVFLSTLYYNYCSRMVFQTWKLFIMLCNLSIHSVLTFLMSYYLLMSTEARPEDSHAHIECFWQRHVVCLAWAVIQNDMKMYYY